MKIKIGSWVDYDFDKEDAKIAVPLILLLLGLTLTPLRKEWLLAGVTAYYVLYFFLFPCFAAIKKLFARIHRYTIGEHSDAHTARVTNSFCRDLRNFVATFCMTGISVTDVGSLPYM